MEDLQSTQNSRHHKVLKEILTKNLSLSLLSKLTNFQKDLSEFKKHHQKALYTKFQSN